MIVFSKKDTGILKDIATFARELPISDGRKMLTWLQDSLAKEVGQCILNITRKRSLRTTRREVREIAYKFMNEAGTYNEGR